MGRFRSCAQNVGVWLALSLIWIPLAALQAVDTSAGTAPFNELLRHLSLTNAQQLALECNWDLLAAAAGVDAATGLKLFAHEFPNPTLAVSTTKINVDDHPNSTQAGNGFWDRSYDTVFAVNQLFEIGGKRKNRQRSAQAGFEAAKAQFYDAKRTLDLGVAKAYIAAALAEENVRVLQQSAATLREEARLAAVRLSAGEISAADKNQIEITAERFELDARTAESTAAQARVALEVLLGVPRPKGDCVLEDRLETLVAAPTPQQTNSTGQLRRRPFPKERADSGSHDSGAVRT